MSVELPIELSAKQAHEAAIDDVNRWRGHCVECFARLERAMGDALELMAFTLPSMKRVPFTFGDKVKELRKALVSVGPATDRLLKSLQGADGLLDQRNRIVHASGKVWIDASGNWAWTYRFKPSGKTEEEVGLYEKKAALQIEIELAKTSQSLCSQLRTVTQRLAVTE